MSQENVEVVIGSARRWVGGESASSIGDDLFHEDAIMTPVDGWPEPGPFVGRAEVARQFDRIAADYALHRITDVEVIAETADWVVYRSRWHTKGAASGIETSAEIVTAARLTDQRIAEVHFRWTPEEALEAAGLSGSQD